MLAEFKWNTEQVISLLQSACNESLAETVEAVAESARSNAPVRTGQLRDSVKAQSNGSEAEISFEAYGMTVEAKGRPWITPAIESEAGINAFSDKARRKL